MRTTTALDGAKVTTGTIPEARITSLDSTKLTGTIAVGRLGNAPATDLTPVRQDLAMLALYSASEDNKAAYNLPRSFIDHFQDDTGTTTRNDCNNAGEYFTTVWSTLGAPEQPDFDNPVQNNTTVGAAFYQMAYVLNSTSGYVDIKTTITPGKYTIVRMGGGSYLADSAYVGHTAGAGSTAKYIKHDYKEVKSFGVFCRLGKLYTYGNVSGFHLSYSLDDSSWTNIDLSSSTHDSMVYSASNTGGQFTGGTSAGYGTTSVLGVPPAFVVGVTKFSVPDFDARYIKASPTTVVDGWPGAPGGGNLNAGFGPFEIFIKPTSVGSSATGTLVSDTQTAPATTKMSGVILYKNAYGNATLGTDLVISLSANNGGAWTDITNPAHYVEVAGEFSTGVKMVKLAEQTVTSGTAPVIKAVWANQVAASRVTQLHGWAMNY